MSEDVLVVGAGVAGLAVAIALSQRGVRCQIIDRSPDWQTRGAGLFTCANGLAALDRLGVGSLARERGVPIRERRFETAQGRTVMEIEEREIWGGDRDSLGISRAALGDALREASGEIAIQFDTTVQSLETTPSGIAVSLSDGQEQVFAAVIGADGLHSSIRRLVLGAPATRPVEPRVARWLAKRPQGLDAWTLRAAKFGQFLMIPISEEEAYCYASRRDPLPDLETMAWLEPFSGFAEPVPHLLTNRTTDIFEDQLEEVAIPDVWGDGRIMLIGDAVHAMPPYMAQGGSLALEDAEAAAEIVASGDLSDAAQRLTVARASRTRWVQERNRRREKLTKLPFGIVKLGIRLAGRKSWIADLRPLATSDN